MSYDAPAYLTQLQQILPRGAAWPRDPGALQTKFFAAIAAEFARVDNRFAQFEDETDPRTAYEMLGDWERVLGLPDPCTAAATTIPARQAACWRKLAYQAGQTPDFYVELAASLGYQVEIHEFDPNVDDYDSSLTTLITGGRWRYVWRVSVLNAGSFAYFRAGDPVGGRLVEGDDLPIDIECVFNAAKPAHTHVVFSYPEDSGGGGGGTLPPPEDAPIVEDVAVIAVTYATPKAIDLTAHITGSWTAVHAGAGAKGFTSASGATVTYTPATGQSGADSFSYVAEGPGGTSTPRTVSLTISNPPAPTASNISTVAVPYNTAVPIDLRGNVTGVYTSIDLGSVDLGTCTVTGGIATYTPPPTYSGFDSFTFTATGPGGTSSAATVTVLVGEPGFGGGGGGHIPKFPEE